MTKRHKVKLLSLGESSDGPIEIASVCFVMEKRPFLKRLFSRHSNQIFCRHSEIETDEANDTIRVSYEDSPVAIIRSPEHAVELIRFYIQENLEWPKGFREVPLMLFGEAVILDYERVMDTKKPELHIVS